MILSNLVLEIEHALDPELAESVINNAIHKVMDVFYQGRSWIDTGKCEIRKENLLILSKVVWLIRVMALKPCGS